MSLAEFSGEEEHQEEWVYSWSIAATTVWKWNRCVSCKCCIITILSVSFFKIINKVDIAPNPKHLWGEWTRLQTSPGTNQPCYTSTIKNLKPSKMNSTCSMKAWHRCVALLGPPGRLSIARPSEQREMWKLNSKRRLSKTRRLRMQQKIQLAAYADGVFSRNRTKYSSSRLCWQQLFTFVHLIGACRQKDPRPWHWSQ